MIEPSQRRAVTVAIAAVLASALLLTGCGRKGDPELPPDTPAEQNKPASE